MSGLDENPFGDPTIDNPFSDPAVQQVARNTNSASQGLNDYNPFDNQNPSMPQTMRANQPAIMEATNEPPLYTKSAQQQQMSTQAQFQELERRQAEIEAKAAELARREEELRRGGAFNVRLNNWPPLPAQCPFQPCFYHDIELDIPIEFQKIVRRLYYMWMFHSALMLGNIIGGLLLLVLDGYATAFFMGIVYTLIFVPSSFLCWYRPAYKAFRTDSSVNFMLFFFTFSTQFVLSAIEFLGTHNSGFCGLLTMLKYAEGSLGGVLVTLYLLAMTAGFGLAAIADILLISKIHALYRSTGASMAKAQQEFTSEFMRNTHVQQAAATAANTALQQQLNSATSPRY